MANRNSSSGNDNDTHKSQERSVPVPRSSAFDLNPPYSRQFATICVWPVSGRVIKDTIKNKAEAILSPCFATSPRGITMVLQMMFPRGPRREIPTHMSLYLTIVPGKLDEVQTWPFNQRVRLSILDQDGGANVMRTIIPDPTSATFQRPMSNILRGTGHVNFIELAQLMDISNGFCKDDKIFIKVEVATQGLHEPFADIIVGNIARECVAVQCQAVP